MAAVIVLEKGDDIASVRGKLAQSGDRRVALVIPSNCRAMYRSLAFTLLRRWAEDANCDLVVVSNDPPLHRLAADFHLPTVSSVRKAEAHWRHEDAIAAATPVTGWFLRHGGGILRRVATLAVVLILLGAAAYFALPVATVRLSPVTTALSQRVEFTADPTVTAIDYAGRRVPARVLAAAVDGSDRLPTTGKKEGKARGFVTFGNLSDAEVRLPAGTTVATGDGKRFTTTAETIVPGPRYTSTRAEVLAVDPGTANEAARLAVNRVEGAQASFVAVLNEQPISIDKSRSEAIVAQQDRDKLRSSLYDRLNKQAIAALNQQLKQYESLVLQTVKTDVLREDFDRNVGDDAATLALNFSLRASATAVDQRQIADVARKTQDSALQAGQQLAPESLQISPLEVIEIAGDRVRFAARVDALATQPYNEEQIRGLISGLTANQAAALLQEKLKLAKPPQVQIDPTWATKAYRVQLLVDATRTSP